MLLLFFLNFSLSVRIIFFRFEFLGSFVALFRLPLDFNIFSSSYSYFISCFVYYVFLVSFLVAFLLFCFVSFPRRFSSFLLAVSKDLLTYCLHSWLHPRHFALFYFHLLLHFCFRLSFITKFLYLLSLLPFCSSLPLYSS